MHGSRMPVHLLSACHVLEFWGQVEHFSCCKNYLGVLVKGVVLVAASTILAIPLGMEQGAFLSFDPMTKGHLVVVPTEIFHQHPERRSEAIIPADLNC